MERSSSKEEIESEFGCRIIANLLAFIVVAVIALGIAVTRIGPIPVDEPIRPVLFTLVGAIFCGALFAASLGIYVAGRKYRMRMSSLQE